MHLPGNRYRSNKQPPRPLAAAPVAASDLIFIDRGTTLREPQKVWGSPPFRSVWAETE